ncbi:MAG: hypothetical protein AB8B97_10165 [Granulosicoccus sp.]
MERKSMQGGSFALVRVATFDWNGWQLSLVYASNTDPLKRDTDDDGLTDREEVIIYNTDPNNPDTDGGSVNDGTEVSMTARKSTWELILTIHPTTSMVQWIMMVMDSPMKRNLR